SAFVIQESWKPVGRRVASLTCTVSFWNQGQIDGDSVTRNDGYLGALSAVTLQKFAVLLGSHRNSFPREQLVPSWRKTRECEVTRCRDRCTFVENKIFPSPLVRNEYCCHTLCQLGRRSGNSAVDRGARSV